MIAGVDVAPGGAPRAKHRRPEPEFRSYYDQPVINKPVWQSADIAGYLFLGGLAGAGAAVGAAAQATGRPALARACKVGAAAAGNLSLAALIHDLGRPARFLNMLRVFKLTSPMSVGSWLLAGFVPTVSAAALSDVTGFAPALGTAATAGAAVAGPAVATYTAALISDTAVPAWHEAHRELPFVFASSGLAASAGLGLLAAPANESAPLGPLGAAAGASELALVELMRKRLGMIGEAYGTGRARTYLRASEALTATGSVLAATSRGSRLRSALAGVGLLAGSALGRFGIFHAGLNSAEDPKFTVVPQRERLDAAAEARS